MLRQEQVVVHITPPNMRTAAFMVEGLSPYVQCRWSQKALEMMEKKMLAGPQAKKGQAREPRNFEEDYKGAMHVSTEGWCGIPAGGIRQSLISACRLVNFKMTLAKLSIFVEADGFDRIDGVPLVKIVGEPEPLKMAVRNATGVADIRIRPMWRSWGCKLRVTYDGDQFSESDVANLLMRAGLQVGWGEGRADSRDSAGLGWGHFKVS